MNKKNQIMEIACGIRIKSVTEIRIILMKKTGKTTKKPIDEWDKISGEKSGIIHLRL